MPIGEMCNREVVIVSKETSILEVAQLMRQHHVGDVVVVKEQGGRRIPVGIVTDRDIVIEVVAKGVDFHNLVVGDIMGLQLVTVREREGVFETMKVMRLKGVRRLPVVDEEGGLVGILTLDDLTGLLAEEMNELARLISREQAHEALARI